MQLEALVKVAGSRGYSFPLLLHVQQSCQSRRSIMVGDLPPLDAILLACGTRAIIVSVTTDAAAIGPLATHTRGAIMNAMRAADLVL